MTRKFLITDEQLEYFKKDKKLYDFIQSIPVIERDIKDDLFEALVDSLLSQQISNKAYRTIKSKLLDVCEITPENLYELSDDSYRQCGIPSKKIQWIKGLCSKILEGNLVLDDLKSMSDDEVIYKLTQLDGIGKWTAEMFCIFALERQNIVSYGDYGIRKGIMLLYHHKTIDKKRFERYRKRYSPYGTIASFYLWYIANNDLKL